MPEEKDDYYKNMKVVGASILVIGLPLASIVVAYAWIGHIGPNYSAGIMEDQQEKTAKEYGLPHEQVTGKDLETPPSLRENATSENATA
jgi:hypothetical protein